MSAANSMSHSTSIFLTFKVNPYLNFYYNFTVNSLGAKTWYKKYFRLNMLSCYIMCVFMTLKILDATFYYSCGL